jgi:plasmid stability protein
MAELVLHSVDADLVSRLERRAAQRGVAPEEEHLRILRQSLIQPEETATGDHVLKDLLFEMPDVGEDADFERVRELPRKVEWS